VKITVYLTCVNFTLPPPTSLPGRADPTLTFLWSSEYTVESLVTLTFTGTKCIKNRFEKFEHFQQFFKKWGGNLPPLSRVRGPPHVRPLGLRVCHGNFGDASAYRDRMHKGQTDKQTNKQTNILLYIYRLADVPDVG
jgi:hypothetical protein